MIVLRSLISINQTFTGYGPYDCSAFTRDSDLDQTFEPDLDLDLDPDPDLYHVRR